MEALRLSRQQHQAEHPNVDAIIRSVDLSEMQEIEALFVATICIRTVRRGYTDAGKVGRSRGDGDGVYQCRR